MISREEVLRIAALARLELREQEIEAMRRDLTQMLAYVQRLQGVEIANVEPFSPAAERRLKLRDDQVCASLAVAEVMKNAPEQADNYFEVPRTVRR